MTKQIPWNKGLKKEDDPRIMKHSKRMLENNPMKVKEISKKVGLLNKGRKSWNKGLNKKIDCRCKGASKGHKYYGNGKGWFKKGTVPWNFELKGFMKGEKNGMWKGGLPNCVNCGSQLSAYTCKYCQKCKGIIISKKGKGKIISMEQKLKIGKTLRGKYKRGELKNPNKGKKFPQLSGKNHPNWKGGITPLNFKIRNSPEMKEWRKKVLERDNYICQKCGDRNFKGRGKSVKLHVDHIKPFSKYLNLRFDTNNGRTLCISCHRKTDTYGGKVR